MAAVRHFKIVSSGHLNNSNSPVPTGGNIFVINLHIVPDTPGSVEAVVRSVEKGGGMVLMKPKHLSIQYNNNDLQCGVVSTGQVVYLSVKLYIDFEFTEIFLFQGWFVRPVKSEIKSKEFKNCYNRDQPSHFTLEIEQIVASVNTVSLELVVSQTVASISPEQKHSVFKLSLSTDQSSSQQSSSGCSSLSLSPHCQAPTLRLSPAVRMYLCAALDSGDWTRLAAGLRFSTSLITWMEVTNKFLKIKYPL